MKRSAAVLPKRPRTPSRRRAAGRLALSALLLAACQHTGCQHEPSQGSAKQPNPDPGPVVEPQDDPPGETLERPEGTPVLFEVELARVERVRGLESRRLVEGMALSREQLLKHVQNALRFERPPEYLRGSESMLVGLGLVDPQFDFEDTMLDLLAENLAGLYEPRLDLMLIRHDLPEALRVLTLRHELVHALQDQHYDLSEIVEATPDDTDRSSALSCLAEGDATSAMLDGVLPGEKTALDVPESEILAQFFSQPPTTDAPAIIVSSLYAPYVDGLLFVHRLRRRGGFAEVDRAWTNPPVSTEQVLHLDKYDVREAPIEVGILPPPKADAVAVLHDVWGEQSLRLALEEWSGRAGTDAAVVAAAAGWGGDRIVVYQRGAEEAVAWSLVMDSEADAHQLVALVQEAGSVPQANPAKDDAAPAQAPESSERKGEDPATAADRPVQSWTLRCLVLRDRKTLGLAQSGRRVVLLGAPSPRGMAGTCAAVRGWWTTLETHLTQVGDTPTTKLPRAQGP